MPTLTYNDVPKDSETYQIQSNVTEIGTSCFQYCKYTLKSFSFIGDPQLTTISDGAFYLCKLLKTIDLSPCTKLKTIRSSAFSSCYNIALLKLPDNLETIGIGAFYGDHEITNVSLPSSVKTLGIKSFAFCRKLTSFEIKNDSLLQTIDTLALYGCNITSLYLPKNLSKVSGLGPTADWVLDPRNPYLYEADDFLYSDNNRTICWCRSKTIQNLTLGEEIDTIGSGAFWNCESLKNVCIKKIVSIKNAAFSDSSITSLNITSVNEIEDLAFYRCQKLSQICLSNLTKLYSYVFDYCDHVKSISDFYSENYKACNNMLIDINKDKLILYASASPSTEIEINCSTIRSESIYSANNLKKIVLKNTQNLESHCCDSCKDLKTIFIPKTLISINRYAFYETYPSCIIIEDDDEIVKSKLIEVGMPENSFFTVCPVNRTYVMGALILNPKLFKIFLHSFCFNFDYTLFI